MPRFNNLVYFKGGGNLCVTIYDRSSHMASLAPVPDEEPAIVEHFFFTFLPGQEAPVANLPDLSFLTPDEPKRAGSTDYTLATLNSLFVYFYISAEDAQDEEGVRYPILHIVHFVGETDPRVLIDNGPMLVERDLFSQAELDHLAEVLQTRFGL